MHSADRLLDPCDLDILRKLEEDLWRTETRFDNAVMEGIFASDFFEFGQSGRTYARAEMFFEPGTFRTIEATFPLPDFHARHLSDDIVQVTYVSEVVHDRKTVRANRSSIWSRVPGGWALRFHQGTPI